MRVLLAAWLALLLAVAACGTRPPPTHFDSQLSYNRTFDIALAAMADQRMVFSEQDRRFGRIVGEVGGSTVQAQFQAMPDGTTRVSFSTPGQSPEDQALLQRVAGAYRERSAQLGILGGFGGGGGSPSSGPNYCPGGPALCPDKRP